VPEAQDVVFLYVPPWDGPTRFSKHHLARMFAEHDARVLYVEAPLTLLGLRRRGFGRELRLALRPPRQVRDRLWVRRHLQLVPYHAVSKLTETRLANRIGQRLLAPVLRRDLQRLGFHRPLIVAGLPHAVDVLPQLPKACVVYHCADDYAHVRGFPRSLPELEAELCASADLVVTTSETLCANRRLYNSRTYWVPNGADVAHFSQPAEPALELRELPRPVIGFVGGLSQWVDLELVASLARARPGWTFALVGPLSIDAAPLRGVPNVRLLGPRAYETVPRYLAAMDVALIPFRDEPVTYHADPIKAYEYLAAGLPVVATDLPALRRLRRVLRLAHSQEAFLEELDAAVSEGRAAGRAQRQEEARNHSWQSRFEEIQRLLRETCGS
jgi:glycosyltransferase involved in cell wall biosynthesis